MTEQRCKVCGKTGKLTYQHLLQKPGAKSETTFDGYLCERCRVELDRNRSQMVSRAKKQGRTVSYRYQSPYFQELVGESDRAAGEFSTGSTHELRQDYIYVSMEAGSVKLSGSAGTASIQIPPDVLEVGFSPKYRFCSDTDAFDMRVEGSTVIVRGKRGRHMYYTLAWRKKGEQDVRNAS